MRETSEKATEHVWLLSEEREAELQGTQRWRGRTKEGNIHLGKRLNQIEGALLHQGDLKLDPCANGTPSLYGGAHTVAAVCSERRCGGEATGRGTHLAAGLWWWCSE